MSISTKLLILCFALAFVAVQAQAFPGAAAPTTQTTVEAPSASSIKGTVIETMDASGYTYLHLNNDGKKIWAAIPGSEVKVGDEVEIASGAEMKNFSSKSLGRTFESIIFSQGLVKR